MTRDVEERRDGSTEFPSYVQIGSTFDVQSTYGSRDAVSISYAAAGLRFVAGTMTKRAKMTIVIDGKEKVPGAESPTKIWVQIHLHDSVQHARTSH